VHFENTTVGAPFAPGPAFASKGIARSGTANVEVDPSCHAMSCHLPAVSSSLKIT
jgi:hypothetical protein